MWKMHSIVRPLAAMLVTGGVMASSATIVTAAADTKPAAVQVVKDGLSVTVTPEHAVVAADQPPAFDVRFTNLRDSAIRLAPVIARVDAWSITAEETTTGAAYHVHSIAPDRRRTTGITTLASKDAKSVRLDFSEFEFVPVAQEHSNLPLKHLPPGKYRLKIVMTFESIFDIPEATKAPAWIGELKADAVMFEMAAK